MLKINKFSIVMRNFKQFSNILNEFHNGNSGINSIIQITIKNFDQICAICDDNEVIQTQSLIQSTIENFCKSNFLHYKIFEYHNFYYCLVSEKDPDIIERVSMEIHISLVNNVDNEFFPDTRVVATNICNISDISYVLRLLLDLVHYTEEHRIFSWIQHCNKVKEYLKNNYHDLHDLRKSMVEKTACFAFQPIINSSTGKIAYHECLLRLSDEDYKLISAGRYIMLAERYGYITNVDKYVFEMGVQELLAAPNISLSINISNIGVQNRTLVKEIEKLVYNSEIGSRLIIEITETAMNDGFLPTKYFCETFKAMGCRIALDDFGAGHTSFNQVKRFPIDIIKIDGSYVRNIVTDSKSRILVETLIKTAEDLGCKTVAEFVENGEIAKQLIELNVDYMQGNFFSPAVNYRNWEKE